MTRIAPIQKAQGLAKKHECPLYVYANPDHRKNARPYVIGDEDPGADVWPLTIVYPDGHTERRAEP